MAPDSTLRTGCRTMSLWSMLRHGKPSRQFPRASARGGSPSGPRLTIASESSYRDGSGIETALETNCTDDTDQGGSVPCAFLHHRCLLDSAGFFSRRDGSIRSDPDHP